jgi:antitoxin component of MazEF toxin-antitoxin module
MAIFRDDSTYFKHGGSWAVRLPPKIREALGLRPGDLVLLTYVDDHCVVSRYDPERILPRQEAKQLVSRVSAALAAG